MENQTRNEPPKGVLLRLKRVQGDERQTYANNFVFQIKDDEFHMRFYQISPPIVLGETPEDRKIEIEEYQGAIEAPCVSHIVMTTGKLQEFVEVLNRYLENRKSVDSVPIQGDTDGDSA